MSENSKECTRCHKMKSLEEFNRSNQGVLGRASHCKECKHEYYLLNRKKIAEKTRKYCESHKEECALRSKQYAEKYPEKVVEQSYRYYHRWAGIKERSSGRWKKLNPEKVKAHDLLEKAIERGTIKRPEICSKCGRKTKIEGHHSDYSKPLEVIWLCHRCHVRLHWRNKSE